MKNVDNSVHFPFTIACSAPEDVRLVVVDVEGAIVGELDAPVMAGVGVAVA